VARYEGGKPDPLGTFTFAGTFLQEGASPALRAALYRVIEDVPGIRWLGPMTDYLGRHGVGIGAPPYDGVQQQLIFDPTTSTALEERRVQVSPAGGFGHFPVGTVVGYTVYVTSGVVRSDTSVLP
jgi:hypothetical protein